MPARERIGRVVVGVPGVVDAEGRLSLTHFLELEGMVLGDDLGRRLGLDVTLVNDINLAALGEEWQGVARGVDDFAFLSVGTGLGMGLVLGGELHSGRHGAAGELDHALLGFGSDFDPSASAVSAYAAAAGRRPGCDHVAGAALRAARGVHRRPPRRCTSRRPWSPRSRAGSRSTSRRSLPSRTWASSCSAAASAPTATCCSSRSAGMLASWLPYPPRLEISSLGEAAVLYGALAIGLRTALDEVFVNRAPAAELL